MKPTIRLLEPRDFRSGFIETLSSLSPVDLSPDMAEGVWRARKAAGVHTVVADHDGRVVGTASLIVERKFIHGGGKVGHVEDVAVHPDFWRRGIGTSMVDHLTTLAREWGCYKVILNCFDRLVPFYERIGYHRQDVGLRFDCPKPA
jgi:glucosamine-phosphate N-acetyltransferase